MVVISDNAGTRGGTLIGKEHGTGMNDDWKSPKASIFDKKNTQVSDLELAIKFIA